MRYILVFNIFVSDKIYRNEPFISIYYKDDLKAGIANDYIKQYCKDKGILTVDNYNDLFISAVALDTKTHNSASFTVTSEDLYPIDSIDDATIEYLLLPAFKHIYSNNYAGTVTDTSTIKGIYFSIKANCKELNPDDFKTQIMSFYSENINEELKNKLIEYLNKNIA